MEVVVTTGAKDASQHVTTNKRTPIFTDRTSSCRPTNRVKALKGNIEGKLIHVINLPGPALCSPYA